MVQLQAWPVQSHGLSFPALSSLDSCRASSMGPGLWLGCVWWPPRSRLWGFALGRGPVRDRSIFVLAFGTRRSAEANSTGRHWTGDRPPGVGGQTVISGFLLAGWWLRIRAMSPPPLACFCGSSAFPSSNSSTSSWPLLALAAIRPARWSRSGRGSQEGSEAATRSTAMSLIGQAQQASQPGARRRARIVHTHQQGRAVAARAGPAACGAGWLTQRHSVNSCRPAGPGERR